MNASQRVTVALSLLSSVALATHALADLSHRQSSLTVKVQTVSGEPLAGAEVSVEMLNHAFRFGTSVELRHIDPEDARYDEWTATELEKYFNSITYGNDMKWSYFEASTPERMQEIAALAKSYKAFGSPDGMRLRGHATVWGSRYQLPNDVQSSNNSAYLHDRILKHVADYHTTFKDAGIDSFDLYNEHFHERALLIEKVVPDGNMAEEAAEVATWFNKAKEVDPNAVLFINDYNILNFWNDNDADVIAYKAFVDAVRDAGGQIDGIGLQGHMDRPTTTKERVKRRLDLLAAPMAPTINHPEGLPGLRIEITELDMNVDNESNPNPSWENPTAEQQAEITENVLTAAFEHPSVDGVTIWGMNDYFHWRDNAIMYDDLERSGHTRTRVDPVLKQSGEVWINYVTKQWWTDLSGSTDALGKLDATVFKGTHKVTVTFNGETKELVQEISEDGEVLVQFSFSAADATSYSQWASFHEWPATGDSLRDADPDGDGRSNYEEYVSATDPLVADNSAKPRVTPNADGSLSLSFAIRTASAGLQTFIEQSTDLMEWTAAADPSQLTPVSSVDGVDLFQAKLTPTETPVFYRVRVQESAASTSHAPAQIELRAS